MVPVEKINGTSEVMNFIKDQFGESEITKSAAKEAASSGTAMIKDETRCIRCGLCARRCPVGAITMEAFWFEEQLVFTGESG
jgi:ferredoxin